MESRDTVAVRVQCEQYAGAVAAIGLSMQVSARLTAPVGTRIVVDAVAMAARQQGRRYESHGL